jgi:hypothetical protein
VGGRHLGVGQIGTPNPWQQRMTPLKRHSRQCHETIMFSRQVD